MGSAAEQVKAGFASDVDQFASQIAPHVPDPEPLMRFVDIGCGIGFALLALRQLYGVDNHFVGIDRAEPTSPDSEGKIPYGFSESPSAYNSLKVTENVLVLAGVAQSNITCIDIDTQPFPRHPANVVVSTFAWGFHFPVQTFIEEVKRVLVPRGVMIIDVRRGHGQEAVLLSHFDIVQSWPGPKDRSDRLILRKRIGE